MKVDKKIKKFLFNSTRRRGIGRQNEAHREMSKKSS